MMAFSSQLLYLVISTCSSCTQPFLLDCGRRKSVWKTHWQHWANLRMAILRISSKLLSLSSIGCHKSDQLEVIYMVNATPLISIVWYYVKLNLGIIKKNTFGAALRVRKWCNSTFGSSSWLKKYFIHQDYILYMYLRNQSIIQLK